AGVVVLSLAIVLGWLFTPQWRWDHKTLLSVMGWLVLVGLLTGRRVFGWRGRRATRWLYLGAALLLLSYAGTRFVLEVVLQRPTGG
ncbi:MAG TPA: cytochrome c biogenesis protein CcsA, partial [Burkholderiaceae bacterium]|nr:cytochrome c biogenesis protein CcsA [Burkholderiaceae bacterium]